MSGLEAKAILLDALDPTRLSVDVATVEMMGKHRNFAHLGTVCRTDHDRMNFDIYDQSSSIAMYQNTLSWLFATMQEDERSMRRLIAGWLRIRSGQRVLVTGCGLGGDVGECLDLVGPDGIVHAQDLSAVFVNHAADALPHSNVVFTVSNALDLPYKSEYFDAVFHLGGINFFGDVRKGISEMNRVCKTGGRVLFGDESVAPHLRGTEYGDMVMANSRTWAAPLPLDALPESADEIELRFVLGNCFYVIAYTKTKGPPQIDPSIPHKGFRGGSMRTRYLGVLEGIDPELKAQLYAYAKENDASVSDILTDLVSRKLKSR